MIADTVFTRGSWNLFKVTYSVRAGIRVDDGVAVRTRRIRNGKWYLLCTLHGIIAQYAPGYYNNTVDTIILTASLMELH